MQKHSMPIRTLNVVIVLAAIWWGSFSWAAEEKEKSKQGGTVAGILMNNGNDGIEVLPDGEDASVKYVVGDGFDKKMFNGIYSVSRVQIVYKMVGETRQLVSIKKEKTHASGTVTGVVLFANDFWVAVKPKDGSPDGYASVWPVPQTMTDQLKALQKGDTVKIKFITDGERHRIVTLRGIQ